MNRAIRTSVAATAIGALAIPVVPAVTNALSPGAPSSPSSALVEPQPTARARAVSASVGPGFAISMSKSRVRPGMFTIRVSDLSTMHNFHLQGPGVNKKTKITTTGTRTWNVRLRVGTYRFQCDMHPTQMFGQLKVVRRR